MFVAMLDRVSISFRAKTVMNVHNYRMEIPHVVRRAPHAFFPPPVRKFILFSTFISSITYAILVCNKECVLSLEKQKSCDSDGPLLTRPTFARSTNQNTKIQNKTKMREEIKKNAREAYGIKVREEESTKIEKNKRKNKRRERR